MSDQEKNQLVPENVSGNFEVEELDENALEDVSGGTESSNQTLSGDINNFQCNC
jgi:hypothetical protein